MNFLSKLCARAVPLLLFAGPLAVKSFSERPKAPPDSLTALKVTEESVFTVESSEIDPAKVTALDLSNQGYTKVDLTGFDNLRYLDVSHNKLTSLDVSQCSQLECLDCSYNTLEKLNLGDIMLSTLDCSFNALPYLNLGDYPFLELYADSPFFWKDSYVPEKKTQTSLSPQRCILPSNMKSLNPSEQFPGLGMDLLQFGSVQGAVVSSQSSRISNITKNAVIEYLYPALPSSQKEVFLMKVSLEFSGPADPALDPQDPVDKPLLPFEEGQDLLPSDGVEGKDPVPIKTDAMHRLYNPNSGEHFYTRDLYEKSVLTDLGWKDEGIGWTAPSTSLTPVYRLYNRYAGDHHYTLSLSERDELRRLGWNYEGIGWYSDDAKGIPLYRQYNPNAKAGSHNYTADRHENDVLVSLGWKPEGISWYGIGVLNSDLSEK